MYVPIKNKRPLTGAELDAVWPDGMSRSPSKDDEPGVGFRSADHPIWTFLLCAETETPVPCSQPRVVVFGHTGRWERLFAYAGPLDSVKPVFSKMFARRDGRVRTRRAQPQ